jgi:hypothetical protein
MKAFIPQLHISPRGNVLVERAYTQQDRRPTCRPGRVLGHLELLSIGIVCTCKAGTDAPSFGESSKLPEQEEYASCPQCHHTSRGAHLGAVLCPPARAKDEPSARMSPLARIPEKVVFGTLVQILVFGCAYERIADKSCSESTLRREGVMSGSNSG